MYKAVIFDMDGVIVDSEPLWEKAEFILLKNLGLKYEPVYRDKIVGLNQNDSAFLLKEAFNLKLDIQEIISERIKILLTLYDSELYLFDGITDLINECLNNNLKIGLASSSPMSVIEFVLFRFNIQDLFHSVVSGECTKSGKPSPDIYIEASRQLLIKPEECIAIEDSINGVISAKSAGMFCIALPDPRLPKESFSSADILVDKIEDINICEIIY